MNERWQDKHYSFFQHVQCEYFPCHKIGDTARFNCLFCYCPLYALADRCGGAFRYTEKGVKDCSGCTFPHERENFGRVLERFRQVASLADREVAE